jgi:hypothetical protein
MYKQSIYTAYTCQVSSIYPQNRGGTKKPAPAGAGSAM